MTRRMLTTLSAALMALPLMAQPGGRGGPGPGNRLDFLAGYLGLSDSQKEQAKTIFDAAQEAGEGLNGELSGAREALNAAVKKNAADAEIDQLAAAIGVVNGRLAAIQAKASAKFYALLTAEQKTKYDQMGDRGGPGGPGRFRRPRGQ